MKTKILLKIACSIAFFVTTIMALAQDSIVSFEPLPSNSEKLKLVLPKAYWGNKHKITIVNYGIAKMKQGITSVSQETKKGVSYSETKQKYFINLTDSNNNISTLQAQIVQYDKYAVKKHFLGNTVLEALGTGVEMEEVQNIEISPKEITGTITTDLENNKNWEVNLAVDLKPSLFAEIGNLTDGERTINVILTNLDSNKKINENGDIYGGVIFYEFIENGISIGAVASRGEHTIWLRPGLDPSTKLILCSAMLLAGGY